MNCYCADEIYAPPTAVSNNDAIIRPASSFFQLRHDAALDSAVVCPGGAVARAMVPGGRRLPCAPSVSISGRRAAPPGVVDDRERPAEQNRSTTSCRRATVTSGWPRSAGLCASMACGSSSSTGARPASGASVSGRCTRTGEGTLWAATEDGMLIRYQERHFVTYGGEDGLPHAAAIGLRRTTRGACG